MDNNSLLETIRKYQNKIIKHSEKGNDDRILNYIKKLYDMPVTVEHLRETGIGRTVNSLRKHRGNVGVASKAIVYKWKNMVAAEPAREQSQEPESRPESPVRVPPSPTPPASPSPQPVSEKHKSKERKEEKHSRHHESRDKHKKHSSEKEKSERSSSKSEDRHSSKSHRKEEKKDSHKSSHREKDHKHRKHEDKHSDKYSNKYSDKHSDKYKKENKPREKRKHEEDRTPSKKTKYEESDSEDSNRLTVDNISLSSMNSDDFLPDSTTYDSRENTQSPSEKIERKDKHKKKEDKVNGSSKKSSHKEKEKKSKDDSKPSTTKTPKSKKIILHDDSGIDSGSGASFAEALGIIEPSKKKITPKKTSPSPPPSTSTLYYLQNLNLLAPNTKLEPLESIKSLGLNLDSSSRKRGRSITDKDDIVLKRPRMDVNVTSNESPSDLQDKYIPHHLIGLMYRLDLSVFCSLRKSMYQHKYPSLSLAFEDSEIDKFNNIVIRYEDKSIHIKIENVDKYYIDNSISYARLFTKEKRSAFFINDYFDSFVKHLIISKSDSLLKNNIEYLIIYTNSCLDLTEEKELKKGRFKNFYPFKFDSIDMHDILKDFLFTNGHGFYQFSQDKITRQELLRRLEFSSAMQKVINERKFCQEFENKIKEEFLDKLIFAVDQPNREQLNSIVKSEIAKVQYDYITLQKQVLSDLIAPQIYEFNLLILFLHDMFLHKNIFSISFKENDITISYKDRTAYVKAHNTNSNICYSQLFPSRKQKGKNIFSINKHFSVFAQELKNDMRYFIIYTNADLGLTEKNELKKVRSKGFYPLKFDSIDMHDILKGCDFYQFSQDKITRKELLRRLEFPSAMQEVVNEKKLSQEDMKEAFLDKLVFAINQPSREELNSIIKSAVESNKVPYNYKELHEIALRWLESYEFGPITKEIMEKILRDIKSNKSSYQKIQKNIDEETKFARSVVGRESTPSFYQFLNFLIKEQYLEVLKRNEISLANMSSVLHGSGNEAVTAFKDLYDLWFYKEGNKKQCLKILEENGINLVNISSILHGTRTSAAKSFTDLYDLWFDKKGNKTQYLTNLEENGVNIVRMSSILSGAGHNAAGAFKQLYNLWFDHNGQKTQYLTKLEQHGIDLVRMSSVLSGAGANAAGAFKNLYDIWFDEKGNRTQCLKTLEKEGINLASMSSILHRAGNSTAQAFTDLYDLWFDKKGNKTQYLTNPAENGVDLVRMSSILSGAGYNAAGAFKNLYNLWFDHNGQKTQYLTKLEENGVCLVRMSSILGGAGVNAAGAFKNLYNLWFDKKGNKTQYLMKLEENGVNLANISSMLHGAGNSTAQAFKDLYNLWFDKKGNKTQYLKILEKEDVNVSTVSSILHGAGNGAAQALKDLYDIWFDKKGNKTQYLRNFTKSKKGFTMRNLSSMLGGAGIKIKDAFEKLHNVCFNDEGKRTNLLNDFYKAGFRARNLSCMLCGAGSRISSILKKLHSLCFNEKGEKTKLLNNFFDKGFRPCDLCNILSGAADSLEQFHDFCFTKETKHYLNRFLGEEESFTLSNLCNIFHGAEASACSALKYFHDVCFDNAGNKTQLLNDFHGAGFRSECLSNILSMAGNNAASILRNLHKSCFGKKNYLSHFLTEEKIFTPEILSKILYGTGSKTCSIFEQLHNLCFDKAGNKTDYLNDLIKNNPLNKIINILYKKVRKTPSTFLDDISLQQQSITAP